MSNINIETDTSQRFARLPEPSRIRETSNTYSRIRFRLGVFSVPDLVLDSLSYLFSVSVLDLVLFKVFLSTGFGFGTVKHFSDSRFRIWYRLGNGQIPVLDSRILLIPGFGFGTVASECRIRDQIRDRIRNRIRN